jgi:UDP:flavonoid glycosyltransferase YjiC (YdhE family)
LEAVRAGVPLLGIPMFGDQAYNAAVVEHRGLGLTTERPEIASAENGTAHLVDMLTQLLAQPVENNR